MTQLLTLTHTSIEYITKRTAFEQASADIPRTLASEHTAPPEEYRGGCHSFFFSSHVPSPRYTQANNWRGQFGLRDSADTLEAIQIFVADIISRSKDVEKLIAALPKKDDSGARVSSLPSYDPCLERVVADTYQAQRLKELQGEMVIANQEYKEALAQAGKFCRAPVSCAREM